MDKTLIGYVLDALDEPERRHIEERVQNDAEIAAHAGALRQSLAPLAADADGPEPPPDLVLRTLAHVAEHACGTLPQAPSIYSFPAEGKRRWLRRPDVLIAAAVLILVGGLCMPAVVRSWNQSYRQACANNLRRFGTSLQAFSDYRDGKYPQVLAVDGPRGAAGVFVPALLEAGTLDPEVNVLCPAEGSARPDVKTVTELENLYRTQPGAWNALARNLAPGYAYSLGYEDGNQLIGPHRDLGDDVPLLSDRPNFTGSGNSGNHGGDGQNVLFIGGHVRWCTGRNVGEDGDDIFLNQNYRVLAGVGATDTVLGPSEASPVPRRKPR